MCLFMSKLSIKSPLWFLIFVGSLHRTSDKSSGRFGCKTTSKHKKLDSLLFTMAFIIFEREKREWLKAKHLILVRAHQKSICKNIIACFFFIFNFIVDVLLFVYKLALDSLLNSSFVQLDGGTLYHLKGGKSWSVKFLWNYSMNFMRKTN